MKHVSDLLAELPLPPGFDGGSGTPKQYPPDWIHDLGADLPAGHLHLWGGPEGAGKTSFLLSLLYGAALRGRRVVYATYHLSASSLAARLLAMAAALDVGALTAGRLTSPQAHAAAGMRACLARLPFTILEARGLSVASLEDRLVRMPFRAEVMAVDYLQAVIRPSGEDVGECVRAFSLLADRLHLAVVVSLQAAEEASPEVCRLADRAGWIAPTGDAGLRRAAVIRNRYGQGPAVPMRLDAASGAFERLPTPERTADHPLSGPA